MTEILAVFKSRAQATDCIARLQSYGVNAVLINTPQQAGVGCGLTVKFAQRDFGWARQLIARANYSAFFGFMSVTRGYGGYTYTFIR